MAVKNITIEMIAEEMEIKPRTIRKILRNSDALSDKAPGRGGRWLFAETDIEKVKAIIESGHASQSVIDLSDVDIDA
jgi:hypothetical protein